MRVPTTTAILTTSRSSGKDGGQACQCSHALTCEPVPTGTRIPQQHHHALPHSQPGAGCTQVPPRNLLQADADHDLSSVGQLATQQCSSAVVKCGPTHQYLDHQWQAHSAVLSSCESPHNDPQWTAAAPAAALWSKEELPLHCPASSTSSC